MPEPTHPSSLSPPSIDTSAKNATPLLSRVPTTQSGKFSLMSEISTSFQQHSRAADINADTSSPRKNDLQARVERFRSQLRKLQEDAAKIKSLMEERDMALERIRWEVGAQGDDMEDIEDRSARTLRGLRRMNWRRHSRDSRRAKVEASQEEGLHERQD